MPHFLVDLAAYLILALFVWVMVEGTLAAINTARTLRGRSLRRYLWSTLAPWLILTAVAAAVAVLHFIRVEVTP